MICPHHGELAGSDYPLVGPDDQPRCPRHDCDLALAPLDLAPSKTFYDWGAPLEPVAFSSRRQNRQPVCFFAWPKSDPSPYAEPSGSSVGPGRA